jgi:chromosome segregation ATPase
MGVLTNIKRRWDSADPERAPPPLPLNPGVNSPTTRANTSATIAAAAKKIVEASRDTAPLSSYVSNVTPLGSPERSLIKGAHHKRMQSLQPSSVKDLRNYLDNSRSPERSPERPATATAAADRRMSFASNVSPFSHREGKDYLSPMSPPQESPTPASRDFAKETPNLRPARPHSRIYGENTPPSATMLALQTMQVPDEPFTDVTNRSGTPTTPRVNNNYDFSSQLLHLTTIATNLQKEMAGLSRRSKDNATDLVHLKDATTARDEDIRRSLRTLTSSVTAQNLLGAPPPPGLRSRSASITGQPFLDSKTMFSSPPPVGSYHLPRAASAHSFLDDGRIGSPSPYSVEGAASVAMLEKIIREMVTKEGQERLLGTLNELFEKSSKDNVEAAKKVEELAEFIKKKSESQALVPMTFGADGGPPRLDLNFDRGQAGAEGAKSAPNEEIMKLLQRIKDSTAHAGGATSEVKASVKDLRGEVLGMGRELGRKLDQVSEAQLNATLDRSIEDNQGNVNAQEVHRVLEDGLNELKQQIHVMLQERAAHDDDSFKQLATTTKSGPGSEEIFALVKHALAEQHETASREVGPVNPSLERDDVLEAVKDGLKDFEPNIELQQFGLEREEVLAVLKEGLEDYQNNRPEPAGPGIDKAEIFEAMQEALKDFQPASPDQLQSVREDILGELRIALEEFRASPNAPALDDESTRAVILEAVRQGFSEQPIRELEISKDDLFDAVKASIDGTTIPFNSFGEQVLQQLHELVDGMRVEFKQYSAANGRDTEQVLDAVKDGLESLRAEIENYVDRAQDVTGKDEIVDTVKMGLEQLRTDVQGFVASGPSHDSGKADLLEYIRSEFEHLHETLEASESKPDEHAASTAAIILAIKESMDDLKAQVAESRAPNTEEDEDTREEMFAAMKEEFEQLRGSILNAHATDKGELQETIQDSMGALHAKLEGSDLGSRSVSEQEEAIQMLRDDIAELKEMIGASASAAPVVDNEAITEGIKQTIDELRATLSADQSESSAVTVNLLKEELEKVKESVADAGAATVDNESITEGIKQTIDELRATLSADQSEASAVTVNLLKEELDKIKESMGSALVVAGSGAPDNSEMLSAIREGLEDLKETTEKNSGASGVPTELLEAMRGEFEQLRNSIDSTMVHGGSNEEVMDTVRLGLDDLRGHIEKKLDSPERTEAQTSNMLDAINEGLETLRLDVVKTLDKPADLTVNYEILDTLKDGLAGLRVDLDLLKEKRPTSEPRPSGTEMVLADGDRELSEEDMAAAAAASAAAAGVGAAAGSQSVDVERMEVLLSQLQIKIEAMDAAMQDSFAAPAEGTATKVDIEGIEMAIRDMQESVNASANREPPAMPEPVLPEGLAMKEDVVAIEALLQGMREQVEVLALAENSNNATKEQVEMVEGVAVVTKEAIDELSAKIEGTIASKDDVAAVELLAQDAKTMLEELKEKVGAEPSEEEQALRVTKADLDILGVLCTEIKEKVAVMELLDPTEMPTKADVEQLQGLIADFRESHDKMKDSYESDIAITAKAFDDRKTEFQDTITHIEEVKANLVEIKEELVAKLAESETGVNTLGETLKSLEEKTNMEGVNADVKEVLEIVKAEFEKAHGALEAMKTDGDVNAASSLEKQGEHKEAIVTDLGAKLDTLFDGMMSKFDDAQTAADEKAKAVEEKVAAQDELFNNTKVMTDELKLSIDTLGAALTTFTSTYPDAVDKAAEDSKTVYSRVDDTWTKVDEAHQGLLEESKLVFTRVEDTFNKVDEAHQGLLEESKTVFNRVDETFNKVDEAHQGLMDETKTVFTRVDETYNKVDEAHQGLLQEHTVTREELEKVVAAVAAVQSDLTEHNPRFMMSLKEVQALVGQHYEHSQQASESAAEHSLAMKELQEQIKASFEESKANEAERAAELKRELPALLPAPEPVEAPEKYDDSAVHEKLDQIMTHASVAADTKYDDAAVHTKLDELMGHASQAADPSAQLERLDQIHEKVMATAAEVSAFVALQSKQITADHESKEREAEEISLLLERRLVQKDQIESDITGLNDEKDSLRTMVDNLRAEREALAAQKSKMQADVASLETALHIRRDELHAMDARAEQIEKRMLEGVMNQSRMMLLAKSARVPKPVSPKKKQQQGRDLRIPSNGSAMSEISAAHKTSQALTKIRPPMARMNPAAERRIMSLSEINNNVPTGAHAYKSKVPSLISSNSGVSRSHSVKSNFTGKPSWKTDKRIQSLGPFNKENEISEDSEGELDAERDDAATIDGADRELDEFSSDAGTERRGSHLSQTNSEMTYDDRNSYVERSNPARDNGSRFSFDPSEYTYGTGSYMTGSEVDRRDSLESTIDGTIGVASTHEGDEEEEAVGGAEQHEPEDLDHTVSDIPADDDMLELEAPPSMEQLAAKKGGEYAPPSDSGLGTDLPTVEAEGSRNGEYFD